MDKIVQADKVRPGGLRGTEEIDVRDEQNRPWKTSLNKILNKEYQTLTSAATINFDVRLGENAKLTLGHDVTLTFKNLKNGSEGNIIITQGSSNHTLTILPQPKVIDGDGSGDLTITSGLGNITILSYSYNGDSLFINYATYK